MSMSQKEMRENVGRAVGELREQSKLLRSLYDYGGINESFFSKLQGHNNEAFAQLYPVARELGAPWAQPKPDPPSAPPPASDDEWRPELPIDTEGHAFREDEVAAKPGPRALAVALDWAKLQFDIDPVAVASDTIDVYLPPGRIDGLAIGVKGWDYLERYRPWWGDRTMRIHAHPDGTTIVGSTRFEVPRLDENGEPVFDEDGRPVVDVKYDRERSLAIQQDGTWAGRIQFIGFRIEASIENAITCGVEGQTVRTLDDVRFVDMELVDNPDARVRCTRPISCYQTALSLVRGWAYLPNSREHEVYDRNPYKWLVVVDHHCRAVGGQFLQVVNRSTEGPWLGRGQVYVYDSVAENYHRDAGRAGAAITLAGSGCDAHIDEVTLRDLDRDGSTPSGELTYSAFVAWDGGSKSYRLPSGHMNGHVRIRNLTVEHSDGNRGIFKATDAESLKVRRSILTGGEDDPARVNTDPDEAGVEVFDWRENAGSSELVVGDAKKAFGMGETVSWSAPGSGEGA